MVLLDTCALIWSVNRDPSYLPSSFHEDPADRLLVSTAIVMGLRLMTRDKRILEYGAAGHVPVVGC